MRIMLVGTLILFSFIACKHASEPLSLEKETKVQSIESLLPREDFNQRAQQFGFPWFWVNDFNQNKKIEVYELRFIISPQNVADVESTNLDKSNWVEANFFKPTAVTQINRIMSWKSDPSTNERTKLLIEELDQGRATLLYTDFSKEPGQIKNFVRHMLKVGELIDILYQKQKGSFPLWHDIKKNDHVGAAVFARNQGPWCEAPKTEKSKACIATEKHHLKISGLYPAKLQESDEHFCETLAQNNSELMNPFVVVTLNQKEFKSIPYHEYFQSEVEQIAHEINAARQALPAQGEEALKSYLDAAAQAFRDDSWPKADEAWAKMNANNSKWYVRVGPDEVYFEPCSRKAGYHLSFALINPESKSWQNLLTPLRMQMEKEMVRLSKSAYRERTLSFHLPDFIDIVLNAGDSRPPHGATIGQSLPNFGPVANEGRGRTVVMTNLYADADSLHALKAQAETILCKESMNYLSMDPKHQVMSTVLHEAAHNLGPAHEFKVKGKTASEIFGGPMASMLEELKAQTAALYYAEWLYHLNKLSREDLLHAHVRDLIWSFGHISRGMYQDGKIKPYSQLAAIQFAHLRKEGAVEFISGQMPASGQDQGCIQIKPEKWNNAIQNLMSRVVQIKARGDQKDAEKMKKDFIDASQEEDTIRKIITERWLRAPKATFLYSVEL